MTTYIGQPTDQYRFIPPHPQARILPSHSSPAVLPLKRLTLIAKQPALRHIVSQ